MYAEANGTDILTRMATTVQRSERTWNFVTGAETRDRAEQLRKGFYAPTNSLSALGSYSTICPATALAATVSGLARYISPGPPRCAPPPRLDAGSATRVDHMRSRSLENLEIAFSYAVVARLLRSKLD